MKHSEGQEIKVEVRCVDCKHVWLTSGCAEDSMPVCPKCMSFGVATGKAWVLEK